MKYVYAVLALVALLVGAAALGYAYHGEREQKALADAQAALALCTDASKTTNTDLEAVRAALAGLKRRHERALADATTAIEERDQAIETLHEEARVRTLATRKKADEDPDCAALASLAVCAAVADRLWPVPVQGTAAAGGDAH